MSFLLIYLVGVVILVGFGFVVIFNFLRYRYQGDKTIPIIAIFVLLFILTVASTILVTLPYFSDTATF